MILCAMTCRFLLRCRGGRVTYGGRGQITLYKRCERMRCGRYLCVLLLALLCASPVSATELEPARALSASESQYVVQNGDSFASIGSRFGVEPPVLAQVNRLNTKPP